MLATSQRAKSTARIVAPSRSGTRTRPKLTLAEEPPSDDEICRRLRAGDARAAELVYRRVVKVVDGVLWRLLRGPDPDREDLAQQALERIITTIATGLYMRDCSLTYWAKVITQHLALDALRSRSRDQRIFAHDVRTDLVELVADDQCSAEHSIEVRRRAEWLRRALAELPKSHAEAVILHDALGHNLPEVARLTGVTVAAAQSRLCRGRRRLLRVFARMERFARTGWVEGSA